MPTKAEVKQVYAETFAKILTAAAQTRTARECAEVCAATLGALLVDQPDDIVDGFHEIVERARMDMAAMADRAEQGLKALNS